MNKIVVVNDKTKDIRLSDNIEFKIETYDSLFSITNINIEIKSDEDLYFFISADDNKYKINIDINEQVKANIYIFENVKNSKVQYSFTLSEISIADIKHFNYNNNSKQMVESNLIGADSKFRYEIKKICNAKETIDFYIHHCGENVISEIVGDILSIKGGIMSGQLSIFVEEECKGAETIQNINILKYNDGKTELKPNLYIDNPTTTIRHNNNILTINEFDKYDFMTKNINDKLLKEEIIKFIENLGGLEDE